LGFTDSGVSFIFGVFQAEFLTDSYFQSEQVHCAN
jgi:hypothetical protein